MPLTSFIAEDVLFTTEDVAFLLNQHVKGFDEAFRIEIFVLFVSLFEIVYCFDGCFVYFIRKNAFLDDSESTDMYRSRMMRFFRM